MNQGHSTSSVEDQVIRTVSSLVSKKTGVILGERQKGMVQGRMVRRIREVGCRNYEEYLDYLNRNQAAETEHLVSLLTTHHTFFFREFEHFEFLLNQALPGLIEAARRERRKLRFLSAACSKGHEVYTIGMFLKAHLPHDIDFEIVGGDICQESVDFAKNGVYRWEEVKTIPAHYMAQNWARGTGKITDFAKVTERIRKHCRFQILNLVELDGLGSEQFDVIFCRNVFIYFERDQVRKSALGLIGKLRGDGHLIVGLSESLNGMEMPIEWEGPSVYRMAAPERTEPALQKPSVLSRAPALKQPKPSRGSESESPVESAKPRPIELFAIDDSPTVLKLMQKLANENGFKFIGSAKDGREALNLLTGPSGLKPTVITLDLHMPVMNGLEFLKEFRKQSQIPVVLVSSINREEQTLAQSALAAGANDYVEKPALDRWKETSSELSAKVKAAAQLASLSVAATIDLSIDRSFSDKKGAGSTHRKWVIVSDEVSKNRAFEFAKRHRERVECVVVDVQVGTAGRTAAAKTPPVVGLEMLDLSQARSRFLLQDGERALLVFGELTPSVKSLIGRFGKVRTLIEETPNSVKQIAELRTQLGQAVDVFPTYSFAYEADRQLIPRDSAA